MEVVENAGQPGLTPETAGQQITGVTAGSPLDAAWSDLQQLREQIAGGRSVHADSIDDVIARLEKLIPDDEQMAGSQEQVRSARDAMLAALSIGASSHPALYTARRDNFYRELFQSEYDGQAAANVSVQRFVTEHLAQATVNSRMPVALARHVTAHPTCEMNVELYMTTVERLANEDRLPAAFKVGRQGLNLCASHRDVSRLDEQVKRLQAANPGTLGSVMQFASPTLTGRRFDLTSLRGKPVLVVFWATWCPGCVQGTPRIKDFYQRYHDDGLEVVGVSLDVDRQKLAEFVSENQLAWPQMFSNHPGNEAWDNPIAKYYGVDSIPRAFLLSEDGTIVAAHLRRQNEIENAILEHLSR